MILNFIFLFISVLGGHLSSNPDSLIFEKSFGNFQNAVCISTAREEFIFVTDSRTNQILKFSAKGDLLSSVGGAGFGQVQLNKPAGIDASNGLDVFVCDNQNNRIQRFDINLNYIATFDFNNYNITAQNSDKIFYPYSIAFLSTSEIFALADATTNKVVKLKSLDEVSLLFASGNLGFDKLYNPVKIIRGSNLDVYVLDNQTNEIINFDNYGTFVKRLQSMDTVSIQNITFYSGKIYILRNKYLVTYNLKSQKYEDFFFLNSPGEYTYKDIAVLNKNNILILATNKILSFKIINN